MRHIARRVQPQVRAGVVQAGLAGILGLAGSSNVQGEDQKKLDILSNEVFKNVLRKSGQCCVLVSRRKGGTGLQRRVWERKGKGSHSERR